MIIRFAMLADAAGSIAEDRMIVCLCHAVSDSSIRSAAAAGASVQDIAQTTGAGTGCGCCTDVLERIVWEQAGCRSPGEPCPDCPRRGRQLSSEEAPTRDAA